MDITVLGRHRYVTTPDLGLATLLIHVDRTSPAEAARKATTLVTQVSSDLTSLTRLNGPVTWRSVDPLVTSSWAEYQEDGTRRTVHRASARVRARFRHHAELASFLGRWSSNRDVQVADVTWELSPDHRTQLDEEALASAVADAYRRARIIAVATGATDVEAEAFSDPELTHQAVPLSLTEGPVRTMSEGPAPILPAEVEGVAVIQGQFRAVRAVPEREAHSAPRRAV
ncbi:MAG: SIMPL domain-containing protein [Propioniciclava sp.]